MAIQGIIDGYANPVDLGKNVVLVGRGSEYLLLVDVKLQAPAYSDLLEATLAFEDKAKALCGGDWRKVSEVRSNNVNDHSEVTQVTLRRFDLGEGCVGAEPQSV